MRRLDNPPYRVFLVALLALCSPLGAVVTYKFYGKTRTGLPRFVSFLRIRAETQVPRNPLLPYCRNRGRAMFAQPAGTRVTSVVDIPHRDVRLRQCGWSRSGRYAATGKGSVVRSSR